MLLRYKLTVMIVHSNAKTISWKHFKMMMAHKYIMNMNIIYVVTYHNVGIIIATTASCC